jgi:hypothetical protein
VGNDPGNGWGLARGDRTGPARPRVGKIQSRPAGGGPPPKKGCLSALVLIMAIPAGALAAAIEIIRHTL